MNYYSINPQEHQFHSVENYPGLSIANYDTMRDYGEPPSFIDAIFGRSYKEVDFTNSPQNVSELAYNEGEEETNWISEYCSSLGGRNYGLTELEDFGPDTEQFNFNDYISQHQNGGAEDFYPYETVPGNHQGSWFGYVEEDYEDDYGVQETGSRHRSSFDEIGIFHSLFGHLPYMAQSDNM
ncbi:hypothetical protein ACFE04_019939 [Oxalis oulophora]